MKSIVRLTDRIIKRISKVKELQARFDTMKALAAMITDPGNRRCGSCGAASPERRKTAALVQRVRQQIAEAGTEDAALLRQHTGGKRLSVYYRVIEDGKLRVEHRLL